MLSFGASIIFMVAVLLPAVASASGTEQTDTYTSDTQFQTGSFNGTSTTGTGNAASLALCQGGANCEHYRRTVTIDNTGGEELYSAQVHIKLNTAALITAGKMQSNCGDIRLTDASGNALSDGSVTGCNTTNTTITITVPDIAADSTATMYLYYGARYTFTPLTSVAHENINNDMTTSPSPPATLEGNAVWNQANDYVQLTSNAGGQSGSLQYDDNPGDNFDFSTDFWSGGGTGADSIYLYMGATSMPKTENDNVGGYIFAYDEFQGYIGIQDGGHGLAAIYCSSAPTEISFAQETQSNAACNFANSAWHTARVLRTGNEVKMYLDGTLVIDYNPGSQLPATTGRYMGWGARTGGSTNYHRIKNVTLDITASTLDATHATVGGETSYTDLSTTGTWTSRIISLVNNANQKGTLGDGQSGTVAISGAYANMTSGDTVTLSALAASTLAGVDTATPKTIATYSYGGDGTIAKTVANLANYVTVSSTPYVKFRVTLTRGGSTSPTLDSLAISYTPPDDNDGVDATIEGAAPNSGDANNDGIADSQQANVSSFPTTLNGTYESVAVGSNCSLSDVSSQLAAAHDGSYTYPFGLTGFDATCGSNGFTTTVTEYFYNPPEGTFVFRKYINDAYQTIPSANISHSVIGGQNVLIVSYSVTDGGSLDADGLANGTIVDPAGPAFIVTAAPGNIDTGGAGAPNTGLLPASLWPAVTAVTAGVGSLAALAIYARRKN